MKKNGDSAGVLLEDLTWLEAEKCLRPEAVIVVPLGAAAKEHGPHLKLKNDQIMAEYLKRRVLQHLDVVVAPTVAYSYYPAFVEYPGSITLSLETAKNTIIEICRSLSRFGPRRFYVINTGVSTIKPLKGASEELRKESIVLRYNQLADALGPVEKQIASQPGGSHADEIETSMMLYIEPSCVDMSKAARDYTADSPGPLTRDSGKAGTYSPTGIYGDATLASKDKGEILVEALVRQLLSDIEQLKQMQLPD